MLFLAFSFQVTSIIFQLCSLFSACINSCGGFGGRFFLYLFPPRFHVICRKVNLVYAFATFPLTSFVPATLAYHFSMCQYRSTSRLLYVTLLSALSALPQPSLSKLQIQCYHYPGISYPLSLFHFS